MNQTCRASGTFADPLVLRWRIAHCPRRDNQTSGRQHGISLAGSSRREGTAYSRVRRGSHTAWSNQQLTALVTISHRPDARDPTAQCHTRAAQRQHR